jgi:prevent-host-death family protein
MQIDLAEAARRLAELVRAAQRGEPVTITTPGGLIRLEPVGQAPKARAPAFGSMEGSVRMSDDFDEALEDFAEYER